MPKRQRKPGGQTDRALTRRTEANLSESERRFYDDFITEYLLDFNQQAAYMRAGGKATPRNVTRLANRTLNCAYVAHQIQHLVDQAKERTLITRNRVLAGLLREANYFASGASHGARVMSWSKLGVFMGMDTRRIEANLASRGGILLVPQTEDLETWEVRSMKAQALLKLTVQE